MAKIVILSRSRQDGFHLETWDNEFFYHGDATTSQDIEKAFRAAVLSHLIGADGDSSILQSCRDFNWGDAMMDVSAETWAKFGFSIFSANSNKVQPVTPGVIIIRVNQDECLLSRTLPATLSVKSKAKDAMLFVQATVDLSNGAVSTETELSGLNSGKHELFIDFENGVSHPCALNEDEAYLREICYYLES